MALTTVQIAALKADILANPDLNSQPVTNLGAIEIARLYNLESTQPVWRTEAPVNAINDAIDWSKFTPVDSVPAANAVSGNAEIHQFNGRLLMIQTKQMNLQSMLQGRTIVDASKANIRAGLRDAVIALPAGASGANVVAGGSGGVTVLNAMTRMATRFEKLFAGADATTGAVTAKLLVIEGAVSGEEIQTARESV